MLEEYFSGSSDMFAIFNESGTFNRVNSSWTRVLGYAPDELEGRQFLNFVHPHDMTRTLEAFDDANAKGTLVTRLTNRYRHRDGSYRWLAWTGRHMPELGVQFMAARDVTKQQERERGRVTVPPQAEKPASTPLRKASASTQIF